MFVKKVSVQNASPQLKRRKKIIQAQMLAVATVVDDGDDARRAPQGIILAVKSIFKSLPDKLYTFFE